MIGVGHNIKLVVDDDSLSPANIARSHESVLIEIKTSAFRWAKSQGLIRVSGPKGLEM